MNYYLVEDKKTVAARTTAPMNKSLFRINDAAEMTGFTSYALRKGCKENKVPYIRMGSVFWINVPAMMEQFEKESIAVTAPPPPRYGRGSRGGKS